MQEHGNIAEGWSHKGSRQTCKLCTTQTRTQGKLENGKGRHTVNRTDGSLFASCFDEDRDELVRRWNAFEPGGIVGKLVEFLNCYDAEYFETHGNQMQKAAFFKALQAYKKGE